MESDPAGGRLDQEQLLERSAELAVLEKCLGAVSVRRGGQLVLVAGEAGVGKTALLRHFCAGSTRVRSLWGACDALLTPRPLTPLLDIAGQAGGELAGLVGAGAAPASLVAALAHTVRGNVPTVLVLEDLHWADEATLDLLRVLGRRIETLPALVAVTYRDGLDRIHPLRVLLGELPGTRNIQRLPIAPLSPGGVAELAAPHGIDAGELYRRTGGNPFFVTEILAAQGTGLPVSVRDAVLARVARLEAGARSLLDIVALLTPHAELWLLERVAGDELRCLDDCLAAGMLRAEGVSVAFRHEMARTAIADSLSPWRRLELQRLLLAALSRPPGGQPDTARLAHHAEQADDAAAVVRYAPDAAEQAAAAGAHRQAAAQFARALRFASELPPGKRAQLLERLSYECYLTERIGEAIDARRGALAEHRRSGDLLREGDAHRWLSRLSWFALDNATAKAEATAAVELLEKLPPGPELAMAYSNLAQLGMLAGDWPLAAHWGGRAIDLAGRLGETETLVHALNNLGTAELLQGGPAGPAKLEESLRLALEQGLEEHAARAYTNLSAGAVELCRYEDADRFLTAGIEYCRDHDLDSWLLYMSGWKARADLEQGRWNMAEEGASSMLKHPGISGPSRITVLTVLGCLYARRGEPGSLNWLDEALELAGRTGELQRLAPVAAARAEARWLAGLDEAVAGETDAALALALAKRDSWRAGELAAWRSRAGIAEDLTATEIAEPFLLQLNGDSEGATRQWTDLGRPYEAALALAGSASEDSVRQAVAQLQKLGAWPAARRIARQLRQRGVVGIGVGPRSATRRNPAGLTARELQVLELVSGQLRNRDIAARLFVSEKTVEHHMSSIFRKLGVCTRREAAEYATHTGLVEDSRLGDFR